MTRMLRTDVEDGLSINPEAARAKVDLADEQRGRAWQRFRRGAKVKVSIIGHGRPMAAVVRKTTKCFACTVIHVTLADGTEMRVAADRVVKA